MSEEKLSDLGLDEQVDLIVTYLPIKLVDCLEEKAAEEAKEYYAKQDAYFKKHNFQDKDKKNWWNAFKGILSTSKPIYSRQKHPTPVHNYAQQFMKELDEEDSQLIHHILRFQYKNSHQRPTDSPMTNEFNFFTEIAPYKGLELKTKEEFKDDDNEINVDEFNINVHAFLYERNMFFPRTFQAHSNRFHKDISQIIYEVTKRNELLEKSYEIMSKDLEEHKQENNQILIELSRANNQLEQKTFEGHPYESITTQTSEDQNDKSSQENEDEKPQEQSPSSSEQEQENQDTEETE